METKKQVKIKESKFDGYEVSFTTNGFQWNTILSELSEKEAVIIAKAFEEIGYKFTPLTGESK